MQQNELQHHGVKGMKWGVRKKYLKSDGSLNDRGIKKYAKKGYSQDAYNSNKTVAGKVFDMYTRGHKTQGSVMYDVSSKKQNKARAEKYLADKEAKKKQSAERTVSDKTKQRVVKTVAKGAEIASKLLLASAVDDIYYGGAGKKIAKETIIQTGRAAVTAYTMARGGYDIKWYDKHGRRVG